MYKIIRLSLYLMRYCQVRELDEISKSARVRYDLWLISRSACGTPFDFGVPAENMMRDLREKSRYYGIANGAGNSFS
jgi:hypothetical protein